MIYLEDWDWTVLTYKKECGYAKIVGEFESIGCTEIVNALNVGSYSDLRSKCSVLIIDAEDAIEKLSRVIATAYGLEDYGEEL